MLFETGKKVFPIFSTQEGCRYNSLVTLNYCKLILLSFFENTYIDAYLFTIFTYLLLLAASLLSNIYVKFPSAHTL